MSERDLVCDLHGSGLRLGTSLGSRSGRRTVTVSARTSGMPGVLGTLAALVACVAAGSR